MSRPLAASSTGPLEQPTPRPPSAPLPPSPPLALSRGSVGLSSQKLQTRRLVGALYVSTALAPGIGPRPAVGAGFGTATRRTASKSQTPPTVKSVQPALPQGLPFTHPVSGHAAAPPPPPLTSTPRQVCRPPAPPGTVVHGAPSPLPGRPIAPSSPRSSRSEPRPHSARRSLESRPSRPSEPRPAKTSMAAKLTAGPHPST
ncbi:MAG: hypothetical protein M5U28_04770 [Sandaracinaceae bacterium]|nr:hypothetical protein [Sandaracinaceae bacterium]